MQENKNKVIKNKKVREVLSLVLKELKGNKKISEIAYESELSRSVIYYIEKAKKDPQLTTLWRLAEGFGMKPSKFVKLIENKMPDNWTILEE